MTTTVLQVITTEHTFIDNCNIDRSDFSGKVTVRVTDTVDTVLQAAYDELLVESTVANLSFFNSGTVGTANLVFSGKTISEASLKSIQSKNIADKFVLEFILA